MSSIEAARKRLQEVLGPQRSDSYPEYLETHMPHVVESIASLWGTPKMDDYFKELLVTARSDRHGFPDAAATEIFRLFSLHNVLGPTPPKANTPATGWDWVDRLEYFQKSLDS